MTPFQDLGARLRAAVEAASPELPLQVLRVSVEADGFDPLDWLMGQPLYPRFFWRDGSDGHMLASAGSSLALSAEDRLSADGPWAVLRDVLAGSPGSRFMGGMAFHPRVVSPEWRPYGAWTMHLPSLELERDRAGHCRISAQVVLAGGRSRGVPGLVNTLEGMSYREDVPAPVPDCRERRESSPFADWDASVRRVLAEVREGRLSKAVLARRSDFLLEGSMDPARFLKGCLSLEGFAFLVQPAPDTAFLGVTPEWLYRRDRERISTVALAGTRPRGDSAREDARLKAELLGSGKELAEHRAVVEAMGAAMGRVCSSFRVGARDLVILKRQIHLMTPIDGTLRTGVDDQSILEALYPTPAVAGAPRDAVMSFLRAQEPFDRGWYTGAVGWISRDRARMATAIRSCLLKGPDLFVYGGAGIVPGSDSREEWDEVDNKMRTITDVFQRC